MPANFPPIYMLRHGQTQWNLEKRLQGFRDSPLTAKGRAQAADQAILLEHVFEKHPAPKVYCSPRGRALETAGIALAPFGVEPVTEPRIAEIGAGLWEGLTHDQIESRWPGTFEPETAIGFEFYTGAPEGEGYAALRARCQDFLSEISGPTVVITHWIASMMMRGLVCGLAYEDMIKLPNTQGCVFALEDAKETIWKIENIPSGVLHSPRRVG